MRSSSCRPWTWSWDSHSETSRWNQACSGSSAPDLRRTPSRQAAACTCRRPGPERTSWCTAYPASFPPSEKLYLLSQTVVRWHVSLVGRWNGTSQCIGRPCLIPQSIRATTTSPRRDLSESTRRVNRFWTSMDRIRNLHCSPHCLRMRQR